MIRAKFTVMAVCASALALSACTTGQFNDPNDPNRQTKQGKQPGFIERAFASANEPGKGNPKTQTEHDPER